jgi:Nucleotidyl transferase AbiEii toxin, Type IV TA system
LSDEAPINPRTVADYFGLVGTAAVEKDLYVVRAIRAVTSIDAAPFTLVFGGGTALARAHKIVRRMSEDVDFKIVPRPATPVSRNGLRRALGKLGDQVPQSLLDAGFMFDPNDNTCKRSRNENRYTIWQIPYGGADRAGEALRPTIQIELTYASLRLPAVTLPVMRPDVKLIIY